jgi:hypothetical protein
MLDNALLLFMMFALFHNYNFHHLFVILFVSMQVLALLQCSSIAMEDCYVFHCSNVGIVFVSSLSVDLIYVLQKLDKKNVVPFLASL